MGDVVGSLQEETDVLAQALLSGIGVLHQYADAQQKQQAQLIAAAPRSATAIQQQLPLNPLLAQPRTEIIKQLSDSITSSRSRFLELVDSLPARGVTAAEQIAEIESLDTEHRTLAAALRERVAEAAQVSEELLRAQEELAKPLAQQLLTNDLAESKEE